MSKMIDKVNALLIDMPRLDQQIKTMNFYVDNTVQQQQKSDLADVYALLCNLEETLKNYDGIAIIRAKEPYNEN